MDDDSSILSAHSAATADQEGRDRHGKRDIKRLAVRFSSCGVQAQTHRVLSWGEWTEGRARRARRERRAGTNRGEGRRRFRFSGWKRWRKGGNWRKGSKGQRRLRAAGAEGRPRPRRPPRPTRPSRTRRRVLSGQRRLGGLQSLRSQRTTGLSWTTGALRNRWRAR